MKTASQLTDFYYKSLYPALQKLEKDRKNLRYRIILVGLFLTFITLLIYSFVFSATSGNLEILSFFIFGYIALGGIIYKLLIKEYTDEFKSIIIEPLITELDSNLTYSATLHISQQLFYNSKLFTARPDRMNGNDFVKGVIDEVKIQFSDIHAEKKHKDSKGRTSWSTIFQGLFIAAEFNKHFRGETVVLPDTAQSSFGDLIGNWLQSNNFNRDELVKMDSVEFEKEFVVYSTDQIEARYILTPALMQKLLTFKKKSKHPIYISNTP